MHLTIIRVNYIFAFFSSIVQVCFVAIKALSLVEKIETQNQV